MKRLTVAVLTATLFIALPAVAADSDTDKLLAGLLAEVNKTAKTIQDLKAQVAKLESENSSSGSSLPPGAILSFDRPNGCPVGWTEFSPAAGRFIIGVDGDKYKLPYVAGSPEYVFGGETTVTLTIEQMPSHSHGGDVGVPGIRHGMLNEHPYHNGQAQAIGSTGGGKAHNNMPPYVALYICKKN